MFRTKFPSKEIEELYNSLKTKTYVLNDDSFSPLVKHGMAYRFTLSGIRNYIIYEKVPCEIFSFLITELDSHVNKLSEISNEDSSRLRKPVAFCLRNARDFFTKWVINIDPNALLTEKEVSFLQREFLKSLKFTRFIAVPNFLVTEFQADVQRIGSAVSKIETGIKKTPCPRCRTPFIVCTENVVQTCPNCLFTFTLSENSP